MKRKRKRKDDANCHQPRKSLKNIRPPLPRRSKLTLDLMNDHKLIVADFELANARRGTHEGDLNQSSLMTRLTHSMSEHFSKEERVLFPLISRYLGSAIWERLSGEHAEMMRIASRPNGDISSRDESFSHLGELLRAHFATEENVIFWYLDVRKLTDHPAAV